MARGDPAEFAGSDRQGARERAFRLLAGAVAALFITFASLGGVFLWYDNASAWVAHTHQVRSGITDVLQAMTNAESAQRGYLLTGQDRFLNEVTEAKADATARIGYVATLTRDNPDQQRRVTDLRVQMDRRLAVIDQTVAQRRAGDLQGALQILDRGEGRAAMTAVRQLVAHMDQAEGRLEAARATRASSIRYAVIGALAIFAALLTWLFIKALRDISLDREVEADTAERLRVLLRERTLLLDEVNHRVKNSLQQIASVVRLQSRSVADPAAREALDKTLDRIMAVGRVHEQLYKTGGQVGVFDAGLYAEGLARELVESLGRDDIGLETRIEPAVLDLRQAVPLALILNELITNALKYGCPADKACKIYVGFGTDGSDYRLTVADNGVGLPKGFTTQTTKSLGMRAVEALSRQLGGNLIVENPEVGAAFAVVFPRSAV
jgi:two-component sensor histidine kinase